jgi:hypothetical protein
MAHRFLSVLIAPLLVAAITLACTDSESAPSSPTASLTPTATPASPRPSSTAPPSSPTATATTSPEATPTSTPTATPTPEPIFDPQFPLSDLEQTLQQLHDDYYSRGEFAFAVTDLQTGETVGVNLDRPQLTGCSINYFILLLSTIDAQNGRVEESEVGALIAATIRTSNPVTARELYRIAGDGDVMAGVERTAEFIDDLVGDGAIFDHPPLYPHDSLDVDRNNWITAAAMNEALRATYSDGIVDDQWRDYLLEKMTGVKDGLNYLLAVGPTVPVSHKNGFFPTDEGTFVDNDIGIVRFEQDGEQLAYAVSFFSQYVPKKYDDVLLGQRLSTATWEFFQQRYPPPDLVAADSTVGDTQPSEDGDAS